MRREYPVLLLIIVLSGVYLFLRQDNMEHYTLPEIKRMDSTEISELLIQKNQEAIKFFKEEEQWFVTDKKYPADKSAVDDMLSTLKTFKLSLLVSQNQDRRRYDLGPENRIDVKALKEGQPVFEFSLGKTAPSHNHTYVMLQNDKNIYQADGNFRTGFDKTVQDFRDKKVMEFKKDSIKKIIIQKGKKTKTLTRTEQTKENEKSKIIWASDDGKAVDRKALNGLLSDLSFLKCQKFSEDISKEEFEKQKPLCRITLKNGIDMSLSLFADKKDKEEEIKAVSSMNPYVFELSRFNGKEIVENIDTILNIDTLLTN
jgi:hypothetical protein